MAIETRVYMTRNMPEVLLMRLKIVAAAKNISLEKALNTALEQGLPMIEQKLQEEINEQQQQA